MRVIAILTVHNEERFIDAVLTHLMAQGCDVYLCDDGSTDRTVEIAERYRGHGLIEIEEVSHDGVFHVGSQLEHKEALAASLDADWFIHVDADEFRLPSSRFRTLAEGFAAAEAEGYNAVNFQEFTFIPTRESPCHEHPDFQRTMRRYYPFRPMFPHRLNAWRRQSPRVELAWSGGHRVRFPGLKMYPEPFAMRHYLFLSVEHARDKYARRVFDAGEVRRGWHGWRAKVPDEPLPLPRDAELRLYHSDAALDASRPWKRHYTEQWL